MRAPTNDENIVKTDTVPDSIVKTDTVPSSTWDLQDAKCILSMKSDCSIDVKGYRFFTMERLFYTTIIKFGRQKIHWTTRKILEDGLCEEMRKYTL